MKICEKCGDQKPDTNFAQLGRRKSDGLVYYDTYCRKCRRQQLRAIGLCRCRKPLVINKLQCDSCLRRQRESVHRRLLKDRAAALKFYGTGCVYCGETIEPFLVIDHSNNDGAEHRRRMRAGGCGGHEPYAWLRKNNYPSGFQTLCFNCNSAKDRIGEKQLLEGLLQLDRLTTTGIDRLLCL